MKKLMMCLVILALSLIPPIYADNSINFKVGFQEILCDSVNPLPIVEVSYEHRGKVLGLEVGIGGLTTEIKEVGDLNILNYFATIKLYLPMDFYIGVGAGYYDMFMDKRYDIDNEVERHIIAGKEFENFFIEGKVVIADLDIETGIPYETQIEKHSRLDSWSIMIGKKFKF